MKKIKILFLLFSIGLLITAATVFVGFIDRHHFTKSDMQNLSGLIAARINGKNFHLEVASTAAERIKGLSGRESLLADQGMFFIFDKPGYYKFWMKDMKFPLDIVWFDRYYKVIDVSKNISPQTFPITFSPKEKAQYVLEINAGLTDLYSIEKGNVLEIGN